MNNYSPDDLDQKVAELTVKNLMIEEIFESCKIMCDAQIKATDDVCEQRIKEGLVFHAKIEKFMYFNLAVFVLLVIRACVWY